MQTIVASENAVTDRSSEARPPTRWVLASLALPALLSALGTSIANVALPTLAEAFGASFQEVQWIVLAYLLAITTLIVGAGRLGDIAGRRRLLLVGLVVFSLASIVSSAAPTLALLIAARAAQGLGAALMMALSVALVSESVSKTSIGSAMGLLGTMSAIGTALGPTLGGVLIAAAGWRAIFLVNAALGSVAFVVARRQLPAAHRRPDASARFDGRGMLLLALALTAYALAMTVGRGSFGVLNIAFLLAAALIAGLFLRSQASFASPLIPREIFGQPALAAQLTMSLLVATVLMATLVVGPFYLSTAFGLDAARVGLVMSGGPLAAALTATPAGRLVDRHGTQRMTNVGLAGIAAGTLLLSFMPTRLGVAGYLAPIVVITASYALFQTANNSSVMSNLGADQRGVVSGLLSLSRNLGLITGAALMGAVFALATAAPNVGSASPEAVARGMRVTFATAAALIVVALAIATALYRRTRRS